MDFFIRNYMKKDANVILDSMNKVWKYGKLYLFTFVGMSINPILVGKYFFIGIMILTISLFIRSIGVFIALIGTNLNKKRKTILCYSISSESNCSICKGIYTTSNGCLRWRYNASYCHT